MIRLLVNVPPHSAGDEVDPADLGDFAQVLLDAGQAEQVTVEQSTDPVEAALFEIFEFEDQLDAAIGRRARIGLLIAGLGSAAEGQVDRALATASRVRPELFGLDELRSIDTAAAENGFADAAELLDRAVIGRSLLEVLPEGYAYKDSPVEIVSDQANRIFELESAAETGAQVLLQAEAEVTNLHAQIANLKADLAAAEAGALIKAATDTGPSGDADGAAASSVEPDAPSQPAAKSEGGAAKAKKSGG